MVFGLRPGAQCRLTHCSRPGNPYPVERARGRKNGGADPRIVLLLGGRHDLNLLVDGASAVSVSVLAGGWLQSRRRLTRSVWRRAVRLTCAAGAESEHCRAGAAATSVRLPRDLRRPRVRARYWLPSRPSCLMRIAEVGGLRRSGNGPGEVHKSLRPRRPGKVSDHHDYNLPVHDDK